MKIFKLSKPKKASLSLSMNAIVILILAIAMLGLGLTFIRGIFKGITAKVEEAVQAGEITNPPTRDLPMTITPSSIEMRIGNTREVKLAFMNNQNGDRWCEIPSSTIPGEITIVGPINPPSLLYSTQCLKMEKDQINLWTVSVISEEGATDTGTYLITMKMNCYDAADCDAFLGNLKAFTKDITATINP